MAGTINKKLIQDQIFKDQSIQKIVISTVEKEVEKQKLIFETNFESHKVTQELEAGETASNISGTLGGYGNLFSFLGFSTGLTPTEPIKELIRSIFVDKKIKINGNIFECKINIPSKTEFGNISRLPWEKGRSWLFDMERSISGLGAYLYGRFEKSRSGGGIQSKYDYSNRIFRPVKYFEQMYDRFIKNLKISL